MHLRDIYDAYEINKVRSVLFKSGTRRVLDLAKEMKHLQLFLHLSTTFCHVDKEKLDEVIYDSPHDPDDIIRFVQWMDESTVNSITPK